MNGGLTECGICGWDPCRCKWIEEQKALQRVKDGKVVLESFWEALKKLCGWRRRLIIWLWPDIRSVAKDLQIYYWAD